MMSAAELSFALDELENTITHKNYSNSVDEPCLIVLNIAWRQQMFDQICYQIQRSICISEMSPTSVSDLPANDCTICIWKGEFFGWKPLTISHKLLGVHYLKLFHLNFDSMPRARQRAEWNKLPELNWFHGIHIMTR